jgi:hypothetical protein
LITLTIPVKLILKGFEYAVALLGGAFIFAMIVWVVTSNQGLTTCVFWSGLFLGILAVLTSELQKREALVLQQSREQTAMTAHPNAPMLTQYVPGTFQVSTKTIVDLNLGIFDLKLALRTDLERSKSVRDEYMPINQITQD